MDNPRSWILWATLLGITFFLVFVQADAPSLDSDGIHYGAAAEEMARTGRILLPYDPTLAAPYYWHFPLSILPTAVLFRWFGVSPFTAKLYSMTMTVAAVAGLFLLGRILAGPWAGWCAGLAFLLTNHVLRISRQCRPDLPLIAFLVLAFLGLVLSLGNPKRRGWYLLVGLASLGGIMTKEVVGLIPLAMAVVYLVLRREWREMFHPALWGAFLLAMAPVAVWARWEHAVHGQTLWWNYYQQSVLFFMRAEHLRTPWTYYGWAILDKYWYFLPFALAGGWTAVQRIRSRKEPRWGLILLWAIALPVGFSFANHKIHYYILPSYAAAALLVGLAAERWIRPIWRPRIVAGVSGLGVAAAVGLACFPVPVHKTRYDLSIRLAPRIDPILARSPGEVISVRHDVASLLFYSKEITRVTGAHGWPGFRDLLSQPSPHRRYCLIAEEDWEAIGPEARERWQVLLSDSGRLFVKQEAAL